MKGRHSIEPEHIDAQYFNFPPLFGKVTPITLHGRTEIIDKFNPPGPTYIPPGLGSDARKVGMAPPVIASRELEPKAVLLQRSAGGKIRVRLLVLGQQNHC
jgi:hypothetical protein